MTPISTATGAPGQPIVLGPTASAMSIAMVPNGTECYVTATWAGAHPNIVSELHLCSSPGSFSDP